MKSGGKKLMGIKIKKETIRDWKNLLPIVYRVGINSSLVERQKLNRKGVGKVFDLHGQKLKLFEEAHLFLQELAEKETINEEDRKRIEDFNDDLMDLEFQAQEAWGFNKDSNYHNWWLDMPGCECPHMDNRDRQGTPYKIYSGGCPWHGWFEENKKEI